ncbi:MAG: 30S ribosomal protein S1, partial [Planctomycetota bacterium]|nr:30S ribosomal protein S1 [Planctomycetota bacterium]
MDGMTQLDEGFAVRSLEPGSIVKGRVTRVTREDVVVDINYKAEGIVPILEFGQGGIPEVGDEIEVLLEEIDEENGEIVLSKRKADRIRNWERIMERHDIGDIVKGRALRKIKGGLLVDIGVPVFLPASQVDIRRSADVSEYIGRELECKIIKIDRDRRNIVLSRRKMLEEDRERRKADVLKSLVQGELRRGVVKNITDFGAFVDLGGIDGLLHITDMSWGRVSHPTEVVKLDQQIEVKVLDFDLQRERISLGLKQAKESPWENISERFPIGSRHTGPVVNIMPYGCFVKLADGIEGLVHISEMSWTRQVSHPSELVNVGDNVEVVILDINKDKHELSLGMKQTEENPWTQVEAKYPIGTIIEGKVRNMTNYGAFIELEEGIDGLLHLNDMSWTKKFAHPTALLKKGDSVRAVVLAVDQERKRVTLGIKQLEDDPWAARIPEKYHPSDIVKGTVTKLTNFGAFVEIESDLEGLLHISEMADRKIEKPEEVVKVGDSVTVMIINVDLAERKIGLSLRAAEGVAAGGTPEEQMA